MAKAKWAQELEEKQRSSQSEEATQTDTVDTEKTTDLTVFRQLLVEAFQQIKEGSERAILLKYGNIRSGESLSTVCTQLHKDMKTHEGKSAIFRLAQAQNIDLYVE